MGELSKGSGISAIRGGDFELGASGVSAVASSDLVVLDVTPLALMPFEDDLGLVLGIGSATFTRSTVGTFVDRNDGLIKTAAIDVARFERNGFLAEGASTNEALHNRDFTNAVHVKTTMTAAKDATGADGVSNAASTLTATAGNGTVFQTITKASAENTFSIDVRRKTGTGTIEISDDGGVGFTDITSSINSTTYTRFQITTTQANPSIGIRIVTSGDEVEVDYEGLEALPFATSRIEVTTTAVTREVDDLTIDSDNIPIPANDYSVSASVDILGSRGTASAQGIFKVDDESVRQGIAQNAGGGEPRYRHGSTVIDGNILVGTEKIVFTNTGTSMLMFQEGIQTASGTSDAVTGTKTSISVGSLSLSNHLFGHIKDFRIYDVALTADQIAAL